MKEHNIDRRTALGVMAGFGAGVLSARTERPKVAAFQSDITPEVGEPLIWTVPRTVVDTPLLAKGVVFEWRGARYALCAVDWCGIANSTHRMFRTAIAEGAGADIEHVMVQTVHQHTAPYADGDAYALLEGLPVAARRLSPAYLGGAMEQLRQTVHQAAARLTPFDRIGTGEARVERVASARRILLPDGKLITRYSRGAIDNPRMAELPEGPIDPMIKTVAFAASGRTLARLYYYATHPQTFCCNGHATADLVGDARESVEKSEGVPQIYFTGCAGDVTVGKYNDGPDARGALAGRLQAGMRAACAATRFEPAGAIAAQTAEIALPPPSRLDVKDPDQLAQMAEARGDPGVDEVYRAAIRLAFARRKEPVTATALSIGSVRILHLPGEPLVEFQKYAQGLNPKAFVAVAGYGDISPGYLCTDRAWAEGGYEPSASNSGPGTEQAVKKAIQALIKN